MTLPQKYSRKICIDGIDYRWVVRDRSTYMQAVCMSSLRVSVERVDAPYCTLSLVLPAVRADNWLLFPGYIVKPNDLSRWIPKALSAGWAPHRPGPAFELSLGDADLNDGQRLGDQLNQARLAQHAGRL